MLGVLLRIVVRKLCCMASVDAERMLVNEVLVWARRLPLCAVRDGVAAAATAMEDGVMAEDSEAAI